MEETRAEMAELEKVNWEEINRSIEEAMKKVEEELSNIREKK